MKALLVGRVSSYEQEEAGNSLPAQVERMRGYCARNKGMEIAKEYSFVESAYKTKRDEFDAVIEFVDASEEKIAVVFDKVDRFSRNVFDKRVAHLYEKAIENKIELHFVSDGQIINADMSAGDKFRFGMQLGLAKYYSDAISDNVKRAFEHKRRNGEWTGHPRIGYIHSHTRNELGDVVNKDIIPDPERAHLIVRLFELYATGDHSIATLWEKMTALGLRSLDGQKISRSNIELILKDSFYYGIAKSKQYGEYPHKYVCLISKELFEKCRSVREGRGEKRSKQAAVPYIFKGLAHCAKCGCMMTPETKKGRFIYYSCTNAKGICKKTYVPEGALLKPIRDLFAEFARITDDVQERLLQELRKTNEGEVTYHKNEIARIRAEYDRVQRRLGTLVDLLLDQGITTDEYDKKYKILKDQQHRLNIELEEYTTADQEFHIHVATVLRLSKRMGDIFESSEVAEKRAILNYLLQNSKVDEKNLSFELKKPFSAVLALARHPTGLRG